MLDLLLDVCNLWPTYSAKATYFVKLLEKNWFIYSSDHGKCDHHLQIWIYIMNYQNSTIDIKGVAAENALRLDKVIIFRPVK